MLHGLTFIAIANKRPSGSDWEERQRGERLDRHQRLVLSAGGELTYDERRLLRDLNASLANGELPTSPRNCPECANPFALAKIQGVELDCCPKCRGMWFDPGELQVFSGQPKEIPSEDKVSRASRFHCPDCGALMTEFAFVNPHSLLVDRCPNGHGVYLEDGELERVFEIL